MKPIRTRRLILRNWEERDRALFHRINSDDRVMEFFGFRRDREQSDASWTSYARTHRPWAIGFTAAEIAGTGAVYRLRGPDADRISARFPDWNGRDRLAACAGVLGQGLSPRPPKALARLWFRNAAFGRDCFVRRFE